MSKSNFVSESHGAYYVSEIALLKPNNVYSQSIVIYDGQGGKTKFLSINEKSIPVLIEFLKNESKRIKKHKKESI